MSQIKEPHECGYKLREGAVIQFFGESDFYTNQNLTDEVAERYLAQNLGRKKMFVELPRTGKQEWRRLGIRKPQSPQSPQSKRRTPGSCAPA